MKLLVIALLFSLANFVCCSNNTVVKSCDDDEGILPDVRIMINGTLCTESPCVATAGVEVELDMSFIAPHYLASFRPKAIATVVDVYVDYPLSQDNACTADNAILNTLCPVVESELVEYFYTMTINDTLPEISLSLKFSLVDNSDESDITCFVIDLEVKRNEEP